MGERLLSIEGLRVGFDTDDGRVQSVRGVDLTIDRGEVVAVVGESGSGKSVTALAVLGLHPKQRTVIEGCIRWHDEDLLAASEDRLREVRGGEIAADAFELFDVEIVGEALPRQQALGARTREVAPPGVASTNWLRGILRTWTVFTIAPPGRTANLGLPSVCWPPEF